MLSNNVPSLPDVSRAKDAIKDVTVRTPCTEVGKECCEYLKREDLQVTQSFKARGAFNALLTLTPEQAKIGVVTRSSGNFAQAIAYASKQLDIPATIVMPQTAPLIKIEKTRAYGAELILHGTTHQEADDLVSCIRDASGKTELSPFNHRDVIAGQGTIAFELQSQLESVAGFVCPIGGGGLMGGCALVLRHLFPEIQIIGVEPEGAADYLLSRRVGVRTKIEHPESIADGLRAPMVGDLTWPLLQRYVDEVVTVSDEEISEAMTRLQKIVGKKIEPSGAASFAAREKIQNLISNHPGNWVYLISGGNIE